jgi:acetyl esterase/lipase
MFSAVKKISKKRLIAIRRREYENGWGVQRCLIVQKSLTGFLLFCFATTNYGQEIKQAKYKDVFFPKTAIQKNISYSPDAHPGIKEKFYLFDLYEPVSDTSQKRPLIIWLHGGGFKFGSKNARGIKLWSETFAQRGYVCAALNYRLSKKNPLFNFTELKRSCYNAVADVEEAVAFFKKNHAAYRIDANRIILAGNSAGAMIALQAVYSNRAELAELARLPDADKLPVKHNPQRVAAVINFWGGLYEISWLQNARVPIFSAYGTNDKVVPGDQKDSLYGSIAIHRKADQLKIPNAIKVYEGYSHELQKRFNPIFAPDNATRQRWLDAGQAAAEFLFIQLF